MIPKYEVTFPNTKFFRHAEIIHRDKSVQIKFKLIFISMQLSEMKGSLRVKSTRLIRNLMPKFKCDS